MSRTTTERNTDREPDGADAGATRLGADGEPTRPGLWTLLRPLVLRLHFYAGLLIAPFVLVAAISGGLYVATPLLEDAVYSQELSVEPTDATVPLADQIGAATEVRDAGDLVAVRPAPEPGDTTRVLFDDGTMAVDHQQAVFVDPGTGEVVGEQVTYGTSGVLPLRTWIDTFHRSLHLGDVGRLYSELAASWLWVVALGGLALWIGHARRRRSAKRLLVPDRNATGRARTRGLHGVIGTVLVVGFLALSATGLTWSINAGANVTALRSTLGWSTPVLNTSVGGATAEDSPAEDTSGAGGEHAEHQGQSGDEEQPDAGTGGEHAEHGGVDPDAASEDVATAVDPATFDAVLAVAREHDITADHLEITPPAEPGAAWAVTEIDRGFPTQVDAVAVDAGTGEVVDEVRFADFGLIAKLARWGIDLHMGSWGLLNQLLLLGLAAGLVVTILLGYRMWWQRRPRRGSGRRLAPGAPRGALRRLPLPVLVPLVLVVGAVGWFLPLLGISLVIFLAIDVALGLRARRGQRGDTSARAVTEPVR